MILGYILVFFEHYARPYNLVTDNIDTRSALDALRELVGAAHVYLRQTAPRPSPLLAAAARYVTDILHVFGAVEGPRGGIGFPVSDGNNVNVSTIIIYIRES